MSYKIGHCTQCGEQVMVRDCSGRWSTFKPSMRMVDLIFEEGHRLRVVLCNKCVEMPDYGKIMEELLHDKSQAFSDNAVKESIVKRGIPTGINILNTSTGKER